MKIKSVRIYERCAIIEARDHVRGTAAIANYNTTAKVDRLSDEALIRNYLCMGQYSPCATKRECECLDACKYGQRYIALTRSEGIDNA